MKKMFVLFVMGLAIFSLVGCNDKELKTPNDGELTTPNDGYIEYTDITKIPSLNSLIATDGNSFQGLGNTQETLFRLDGDEIPREGMANTNITETTVAGVTTHRVTLRDDNYWVTHEGNIYEVDGVQQKVKADDFVFAWKTLGASEVDYSFMISSILGILDTTSDTITNVEGELVDKQFDADIKKISEFVFEFKTSYDLAYKEKLLGFQAFAPIHEGFYNDKGIDYATTKEAYLNSGPFYLKELANMTSETTIYEKNPHYWDRDAVKIQGIKNKFHQDAIPSTLVLEFEKGNTDLVNLTADYIDQYESVATVFKSARTSYLMLNQRKDACLDKYPISGTPSNHVNGCVALQDIEFREAIAKSYDKNYIVNDVLKDGSIAANHFLPEGFVKTIDGTDFVEKMESFGHTGIDTDLTRAKEAFDAAHARVCTEQSIAVSNCVIDIEIMVKSEPYFVDFIEAIKTDINTQFDSKINATVRTGPWKDVLQDRDSGYFQLARGGWGPDYPDQVTFLELLENDGTFNDVGFDNVEYTDVIEKSRGLYATDQEREDALLRIEKLALDDYAYAPIFQRATTTLYSAKFNKIYRKNIGSDYEFKWAELG